MEHTFTIDSNRSNAQMISKLGGARASATQIEISSYVPAHELDSNDSTELSLQPLNFDNQIELSQAKDFLELMDIEKPDWKVFVPGSDSDEERVFVTEFVKLNGELVGLIAIEMTSLVEAPNSRAAVMSCLLNLEAIEIHLDTIQDYISAHLSHLSQRQGWKDLQLGSISSFSSLHEFQQF